MKKYTEFISGGVKYCGFRYCDVMAENELFYGLCQNSWNKGYVFEVAKAALNYVDDFEMPDIGKFKKYSLNFVQYNMQRI